MNESINKGIQSLKYDPATLLAFNGEKITNKTAPYTDENSGDSYIVIHQEKKTASQKNFDIAAVAAIVDRTYPGALLLANEMLANNMPSGLYAKRAPIRLRISLPGLAEGGSKYIEDPKYSSISSAIDTMVTAWFDNHAENTSIPANYSYTELKVHSKDQLQVAAGFDLGKMLGIDFSAKAMKEKQTFILTFKQIFHTVSVDTPEQPGGFFAEEETWENLTANGVGNDAPPVYVANVSYGRTIYVSMQTSNMSSEIEAQLKLAIADDKLNADVLAQSMFENSEYSAVVLGGNASAHGLIVTKDFKQIEKIIVENAEFTRTNQGAPISYTSVFMKENAIAMINSSADYVETTYTKYEKGSVILKHDGAYVAKFYVTWRERYYEDGVEKFNDLAWEKNDQKLTAGFSTVIQLPANASNIHVKAVEHTGLAWEKWRTVVDHDIPLTPDFRVAIWGTTLSPKTNL